MINTDDFEKRKSLTQLVVKDNALIQRARFNLTTTQQKLIAYIVSLIKPEDKELKQIEVKVDSFCELCGIDRNWFYSEFKKLIDDFDNCAFWVENDEELYKFRWFDITRYKKGKGTVQISLSKNLEQYLLNLTQQFTQYELYNIMALKSKYAIRLFELFKSYAYQKKRAFELNNLKELLCATNYENYAHLKRRVLEPAINEINEYTELSITYNPIYKGRKVIGIEFIIDKKEPIAGYMSYKKTLERIDSNNQTIPGN